MKTEKTPINFANAIKSTAAIFGFIFFSGYITAQEQIYDNFEGTKVLYYGERFGVLDTLSKNPGINSVNGSAKCGLYVRKGTMKFANIKMNLPKKITAVDAYATYLGIPPKIKMKVYTAAPAGTLVEIHLGSKRGNNYYPAGTHSQYQAYTTKINEWEELEFKFSQIPQGSETSADQIDQIVLMFNPNSSTSDTYYFDDLTGPPILNVSEISEENGNEAKKKAEENKPVSKAKKRSAGKKK